MAPTVYGLDSAELTTAAASGGLVHATGYPLYLLVGRFWSHLPIGDVGYRMNLLSAVLGAVTIALLVHLLRRVGVGPWAALCAAGLLASTRYFWAMALVAEVYTLHTALMCGVVLALLRWADDPSPTRLGLATGLLGLAAGNHASAVLLAPGCLFFVLMHARGRVLNRSAIISAAGGLVLGLSVYLYLPFVYLQEPQFNYLVRYDHLGQEVPYDLVDVGDLVWTVAGGQFSSLFFAHGGRELVEQAGALLLELWRTSFVIAFGPALLGVWLAFRRSRALGGMLVLMALFNALFFMSYAATDKDTMYLPVYFVWVVWIGLGSELVLSRTFDLGGWVSGTVLALILAGTVAFSTMWSFPLVDLSDDWSARQYCEPILDHLEPGSLFIGSWETAPVVQYLQLVEGRRPDVQVINRFHIERPDLATLISAEVDRRPVYSDRVYLDAEAGIRSQTDGTVFRIGRIR